MDHIEKARQSFELSFAEGEFYNRQTQNEEHLQNILNILHIKPGDAVLDLGTGSGYLAFAIGAAEPEAAVTGLDIVRAALEHNRQKARILGLPNLTFAQYDGHLFPFEAASFEWVVTRYALHHFQDIEYSFREISRVLKPGGKLFLSDPSPNMLDHEKFIDQYMQLKDDGHNRFYTAAEWKTIAANTGFVFSEGFDSSIRFPRKMSAEYQKLLDSVSPEIKAAYQIEAGQEECYLTEAVSNLLFKKDSDL